MSTLTPFPALRSLNRVVFLDDDEMYVGTLAVVLRNQLNSSFHTSRDEAAKEIEASVAGLRQEQETFARIVAAQSPTADPPEALELAAKYLCDPGRRALVGALVVDYNMPGEHGVAFCDRVATPGLQRMLLTGHANEHVAVEAFNRGLIERYVPKHSEAWGEQSLEILRALQARSAARRGEGLQACVAAPLRKLLGQPEVTQALAVLLDKLGVQEYVLLGQPQGLLGVREDTGLVWIQLETQESLALLMDTLDSEPAEWPGSDRGLVERVHGGKSLVNLHVAAQLAVPVMEVPARSLSSNPLLLAGVFNLPSKVPRLPTE